METIPSAPERVRDEDKLMLVLSYFGLLSLIPFLTAKDGGLVRYHARQGLGFVLCWMAFLVGMWVLLFIPFVNVIAFPIALVGHLAFFVVMIVSMVRAVRGERFRLPLAASVGAWLEPYQPKPTTPTLRPPLESTPPTYPTGV